MKREILEKPAFSRILIEGPDLEGVSGEPPSERVSIFFPGVFFALRPVLVYCATPACRIRSSPLIRDASRSPALGGDSRRRSPIVSTPSSQNLQYFRASASSSVP